MKIKESFIKILKGIEYIYKIIFSIDTRLDKLEASTLEMNKTLIKLLKKYEGIEQLEKTIFHPDFPKKEKP